MQTEPQCSRQTHQSNTTQLLLGWQAAKRNEPLDETQPGPWQEGHDLWTQRGWAKAARLELQEAEARYTRLVAALQDL